MEHTGHYRDNLCPQVPAAGFPKILLLTGNYPYEQKPPAGEGFCPTYSILSTLQNQYLTNICGIREKEGT